MLVVFRKTLTPNRFHDLLTGVIKNRIGDEYVMSSGFFQEENAFSAVCDTALKDAINCH